MLLNDASLIEREDNSGYQALTEFTKDCNARFEFEKFCPS